MTAGLPDELAVLIRQVDAQEEGASGYLTLEQLTAAGAIPEALERAVAEEVLLVDHRLRLDEQTGAPQPVTLCRLNRHHPAVRTLVGGF